jgi:multicomponent Na+:H+ antiporter subunit E
MRVFLWNVLLAFVWAAATGRFTLPDLALGFGLGYLVLLFAQRGDGPSPYFAKVPQVVRFVLFYLGQMVLSNLRLAHDLVTPRYSMLPGVIAVPLDAKTDVEITLLANLITLTPGSVSLDLSPDRRVLYVHVMYIDHGDVDEARRRIKDDLERRVLEVLR